MPAILELSRRNNSLAGVTGALLYDAGCFAQVLEGPAAAVEATFERIQQDFRHDDLVVLEAVMAPSRLFGDWAMAHAAAPQQGGFDVSRAQDGRDVVAYLRGLVQRQTDWLPA